MPVTFRPTTEEDLDGMLRLFTAAFHPPAGAQILDRSLLRWKYHTPLPAWEGSRSFVLERNGELVAHGGVWPFEFLGPGAPVRGVHVIDWAADASVPMGGISLMRRLVAQCGVAFSFGGSQMTREILPKIGFRPANQIRTYARPLRPFVQARTHQLMNYKLPARLARNLFWRMIPRLTQPAGWEAMRVAPDELDERILPVGRADRMLCRRTLPFFRYLSECPAVPFSWYAVTRMGQVRGYFCVTLVHRQARIADLWMTNPSIEEYRAAHTLALLVVLRDTAAVEIVATSCSPLCSQALSESGYRFLSSTPIMVNGTASQGLSSATFDFQMVDSDFAFLNEGRVNYVT